MTATNVNEMPVKSRQKSDAGRLTDVELITILLHHSHYGETALDFARTLLKERGLLETKREPLSQQQDDTQSDKPSEKANPEEETRPSFNSQYPGPDKEVFAGLFLDPQRKVIAFEKMFEGHIDNLTANPDEHLTYKILGYMMQHQADGFVLAHYCPEGNSHPQQIDVYLMQWLTCALTSIEMRMLDYLVMNKNDYFSFARKGVM